MKNQSYFTRKLESLEKSVRGEDDPNEKTVCGYCGRRKKPWSKMCQDCYLNERYKLD